MKDEREMILFGTIVLLRYPKGDMEGRQSLIEELLCASGFEAVVIPVGDPNEETVILEAKVLRRFFGDSKIGRSAVYEIEHDLTKEDKEFFQKIVLDSVGKDSGIDDDNPTKH